MGRPKRISARVLNEQNFEVILAMNERLDWMFPSFSAGRITSTEVRVSWWFALVPLVICPRYGLEVALAFTLFLLLSVLMHEFAHVMVAQFFGGYTDDIHLTPLGGVAHAKPGQSAFVVGMTAAAGPLLNLSICLLAFPGWYAKDSLWNILNPFTMPVTEFHQARLWQEFGLILFGVNWVLLLVNLLPVMPFDGGQILRSVLSSRVHPELVHRTVLQISLFVAIGLLIAGMGFDISQLVLVGAVVLAINLVQYSHEDLGEAMDDSGFGYDFSTAYESLDRTNSTTTNQTAPGLLQRWRERRRLRRERQERIRRMDAERQLDALLAKVHESGLQSLSEQEQKLLQSCSEILRMRQKVDD
jgi:Zn-dependent protease